MALHTLQGAEEGDSHSGRSTREAAESAFLGVRSYSTLWITEREIAAAPPDTKGLLDVERGSRIGFSDWAGKDF